MKRDVRYNALAAAALSLLISLGGVGCMVTGLKLEVSSMWPLVMTCLLASVISAVCYSAPRGGWVLRGLAALMIARAVLQPETTEVYIDQLRAMLHRMTFLWHNAYGWSVIPAGEATVADQPLMFIGIVVSLAVCRTVCRQKGAVFPVFVGLLPLWSCLVVTDTVPDLVYLFHLLLGLTVLILSNSVRRTDLHQGLELTAMASIAALVGLALLFILVPRERYVNKTGDIHQKIVDWAQDLPAYLREWSDQTVTGEIQTVQPQRENLSTLGDRIERDIPALYVKAQQDGVLYLRGQEFDSYDGKSWQSSRMRTETFPVEGSLLQDIVSDAGQVTIDARWARSVRYLPYYPEPATQIQGGRVSNEEDLITYSYQWQRLPENWREITSGAQFYDGEIFATAGVYEPNNRSWRYRTLPLDTQRRAEEILVTVLPGDGGTATGKADAIAEYVRNSAYYSKTPGTMPSDEEDFALWFLEDSDSGYCVHFATATAVLLRAAGVDARYVSGYVLHTSAGQTVAVTAKQSHAWVEYFEPLLGGWVILEATPSGAMEQQIIVETAPEGISPETEQTQPTEPSREPEEPSAPTEKAPQNGGGAGTETRLDLSGLVKFLRQLLLTALIGAAIEGQRRLRISLRRRRQKDPDPNVRALALWREAVLLHRLLKDTPAESLEELAQKAKFSQYALTEQELDVLRQDIRAALRALRSCPWYRKLIHRYIFAAY